MTLVTSALKIAELIWDYIIYNHLTEQELEWILCPPRENFRIYACRWRQVSSKKSCDINSCSLLTQGHGRKRRKEEDEEVVKKEEGEDTLMLSAIRVYHS